ncbi:hypothetical protein ScalyP_jg2620 [Parmales sp. scaly parma]|nr:hypothetical protein ScalyP_jg2620 [Parmales sp. scaly parma]
MRKAWKKRRRSLSPQLIPVTLLTTKTGVLDDVLYLVEKHGRRTKQSGKLSSLPTMALPLGDVKRFYASTFTKNIKQNLDPFLLQLKQRSQKQHGKKHGAVVSYDEQRNQVLCTGRGMSFPAARANSASTSSAIVQVGEFGVHTGCVRVKKTTSTSSIGHKQKYVNVPLSVALRIPTKHRGVQIKAGLEFVCKVVGYDPVGDGGSPLLTVQSDYKEEVVAARKNATDDGHEIENIAHLDEFAAADDVTEEYREILENLADDDEEDCENLDVDEEEEEEDEFEWLGKGKERLENIEKLL